VALLVGTKLKTTPIGLDFGHAGARAVQLERHGEQWTVMRAIAVERPSAAVGNSPQIDDYERMALTCVRPGEFRGRRVTLGVCTPDIDYHSLELPEAMRSKTDEQVAAVVRSEVMRLSSNPQKSIETQFWYLPEDRLTGPNTVGVTAKRKVIDDILEACDRTHLDCRCVDASTTALVRVCSLLRPHRNDELWGILDVGYRQVRLTLCIDEVPVLARTAGKGSGEWTTRISESLRISVKAAEVQKREHGLCLPPSMGGGDTTPARDEIGSMIFGALRSDLTAAASEIKSSYEYVLSCFPDRSASDLLLVGGGAELNGLSAFLEYELGIPAYGFADAIAGDQSQVRWGTRAQERPGQYALALGLAL